MRIYESVLRDIGQSEIAKIDERGQPVARILWTFAKGVTLRVP